jgi:hypothetical protein
VIGHPIERAIGLDSPRLADNGEIINSELEDPFYSYNVGELHF